MALGANLRTFPETPVGWRPHGPFLFEHGGSPAEYGADLKLVIESGWLWKDESGTYAKFTQAGAVISLTLWPLRLTQGPHWAFLRQSKGPSDQYP
jgi:hypothetical protein